MKDRKANSVPRQQNLRRPLRARPEVGGERRRAAHVSAAASGPGPKSAAGDMQRKFPVQLQSPPWPPLGQGRQARSRRREAEKANSPSSCPPLRYHLRARPGVSSERCSEADSLSDRTPSASASLPSPKSAARWVEAAVERAAAAAEITAVVRSAVAARSAVAVRSAAAVRWAAATRSAAARSATATETTAAARSAAAATERRQERRGRYRRLRRKQRQQLQERR